MFSAETFCVVLFCNYNMCAGFEASDKLARMVKTLSAITLEKCQFAL